MSNSYLFQDCSAPVVHSSQGDDLLSSKQQNASQVLSTSNSLADVVKPAPADGVDQKGAGGSKFDDGLRTDCGLGADIDDDRWTHYDILNTWLNNSINCTPRRRVTAHINPSFLRIGLISSHVYAVIGFTANASDITQGVITMHNPWGYNSWPNGVPAQGITSLANGNMSMTLATFNRLFSGVTYAR